MIDVQEIRGKYNLPREGMPFHFVQIDSNGSHRFFYGEDEAPFEGLVEMSLIDMGINYHYENESSRPQLKGEYYEVVGLGRAQIVSVKEKAPLRKFVWESVERTGYGRKGWLNEENIRDLERRLNFPLDVKNNATPLGGNQYGG